MDFEHAARQLAGVWKMAWNRPEWRDSLDRSVDGVFRSFWAFAFAAPLAFAGYYSFRRAADRIPAMSESLLTQTPLAFTIVVEMVGYAVYWAASLLTLLFAARALKAGRRAADVIVGYNWLQVFVAAAQAAPLIVVGLTSDLSLAGLLFIPVIVFVIAMWWGFLRRSLETGAGQTAGLIAVLVLVALIVSSTVGAIARGLLQFFS